MRFNNDNEAEHRRALLQLAAEGNAQARKELEEEYHAYVYSAAQAARYTPKIDHPILPASLQRKFDSLFDVEIDAA